MRPLELHVVIGTKISNPVVKLAVVHNDTALSQSPHRPSICHSWARLNHDVDQFANAQDLTSRLSDNTAEARNTTKVPRGVDDLRWHGLSWVLPISATEQLHRHLFTSQSVKRTILTNHS